jgi:hypothetical protein
MHQAVLLVYTDVDAEQEDAFNRWYDEVHVPDVLGVTGITAARRYKLSGPAPRGQEPVSRYLALYELADGDTRAAMKRLNEEVARLTAAGRMFDGMRLGSAATYVAIGDRVEPA